MPAYTIQCVYIFHETTLRYITRWHSLTLQISLSPIFPLDKFSSLYVNDENEMILHANLKLFELAMLA